MSGHADQRVSRPGLAHAEPLSGARVQRSLSIRDLDALALRTVLGYRRGGDKLCVLALRFGLSEAMVSKALNGWCTTPRRILERLTVLERATYDLVRAEAVTAAARAA